MLKPISFFLDLNLLGPKSTIYHELHFTHDEQKHVIKRSRNKADLKGYTERLMGKVGPGCMVTIRNFGGELYLRKTELVDMRGNSNIRVAVLLKDKTFLQINRPETKISTTIGDV